MSTTLEKNRVDSVILHKIYGPIIFLGIMYLMFAFAINLGGIMQIWVNSAAETLFVTRFSQFLMYLALPPWLVNLLAFGLGRGISITLTFIPVLGTMFLSLGFLERSGYMTRAAFIVDRLMRKIGLSGKSLVPLIVGFGCNVPAILSARSVANKHERMVTILMTPFMSCGARLAIYALFVAAFFPIGGQNVIFSLYLIGIAVAIFTGYMLRDNNNAKPAPMLSTELPSYTWPNFINLFKHTLNRLYDFILDAGRMIIALSVIINGIGLESLAIIGKFITPLCTPLGITLDNWPATLGLLTGMVGKEAVIGTLNSYYLDENMLLNGFGSAAAAYAYLLFTLLYFPCISVVATIAKELNKKLALFSAIWSTGLAYIIAALFYQIATMQSMISIGVLSISLVCFFIAARRLVRPAQKLISTPINVI